MAELKELLEMTGCRDAADLQDMANVGQSLMASIEAATSSGGPYAGWSPADDPAEIVVDLLNDLEDARALLREAAITFRFYEQSHLAKKTQEADEKAHRNAEIAGRIEALLAS